MLKDTGVGRGGKEIRAGEAHCCGLAVPSPEKETQESCGAQPSWLLVAVSS